MSKENLENTPRKLERFIYRLGYMVASELKSFSRVRDIGVKVVVLSEGGGSVLLVRHQYKGEDRWYLPGGGMQSWERPDEAIRREMSEEVIIEANEPVLAGIYKGKKRKSDLTFLFCCRSRGETVETVPFAEVEEARFFTLDKLPGNLAPGVKERVNEVVERTSEGIFDSPQIIWGGW